MFNTTLLANISFNYVLAIIGCCMLPALVWVIVAGLRVKSVFRKYSQIKAASGMTGAETARRILAQAGIHNVDVRPCKGSLTDHYDPRDNTVYLSETTFSSTSVAANGVAAHETGHAIQYAEKYFPVKLRTAIVPLVNFTSRFSMPLLLVSLLIEMFVGFNYASNILLAIAIAFYACYMLFTLITLPVEYNASRRAKKLLLECGAVDSGELQYTSKVLNAAAQTYLASFVFSFIQLCRMLLLLISRRSD